MTDYLRSALLISDITKYEIMAEIGSSRTTTQARLSDLRDQGEAHIVGWVRADNGHLTAVWRHGPGKDARKPPRLTPCEANKRYRDKIRALYNIKQKAKRRLGRGGEKLKAEWYTI